VNPFSREPTIPRKTIKDVEKLISEYDSYVFQNAKFDIQMLNSIGISVPFEKVEDTIFAAHTLDNRAKRRLKDLSKTYLGIDTDDEQDLLNAIVQARSIAKKMGWNIARHDYDDEDGESWMKVDGWIPGKLALLSEQFPQEWRSVLPRYGDRDAERTAGLWTVFKVLFEEDERFYKAYKANKVCIRAIVTMESRGVTLRPKEFQRSKGHYERMAQKYETKMRKLIGVEDFNPGSTKQLQVVLFDLLKLKPIKTTKTGNSTDKHVIRALYKQNPDNQFLESLIAYRKARTTVTYEQSYEEHRIGCRLHSSFNPTGTDTTRLSSSGPNLQNVGKGEELKEDEWGTAGKDTYNIRNVFGPLRGRVWLDFDYSQLQLRIFAAQSGEQKLIEAFENGWDAHNFMACQIFQTNEPTSLQRRIAKNVNFGFIFGASERRITETCGDPKIWPIVQSLFPSATEYLEKTKRFVNKHGYVEFGQPVCNYRLKVPVNPNTEEPKGYTGVVYGVQGLEGLIVKQAMAHLDRHLSELYKSYDSPFLTLQVHDELIVDAPALPGLDWHLDLMRTIKRIMEMAGEMYGVKTPADGSIIRSSWDKAEEVELMYA
jgi:DNA polymerase I-like protein with 3'-5' exonuclease and polymerase domains